MFDNKSLQLASYGHLDYYYFQSFLNQFQNASLVNDQGELLFSKDTDLCSTTTSRLVSFQIVKKYLSLSPGDIFITNDPENGGYNYSKIFFISALTENLFLIWCNETNFIQFKIPLSPLLEGHKKNPMLWSALIETHPEKEALSCFFEKQIEYFSSCFKATPYLDFLSEPDFQKIWFNTCKAEYDRQFDLRAQGQTEVNVKHADHNLKIVLKIEEKQNQRTLNIDFSNTSLAQGMSAASHVIESAMIQEFVYHYKLHQFLSQPILNQIKLIMPPKSIISKAHPQGEYNFELQSLIKQIFKHLLSQMSSSKKTESKFTIKSEAYLSFSDDVTTYNGFLLDTHFMLDDVSKLFKPKIMCMKDNNYTCEFEFVSDKNLDLNAFYLHSTLDNNKRHLKINNKAVLAGKHSFKNGDTLSISWKI